MPNLAITTTTAPEPTMADLDGVVNDLERGWVATLTVRRQATDDIGYREIYVSLDGESLGMLRHGMSVTRDIVPGPHELRVHNTLFRKSAKFSVGVGEHARFQAVNRSGMGTYSTLALIVGFLGAGPIYLTLTREADAPPEPPAPVRPSADQTR
jgi:hypothetical protein